MTAIFAPHESLTSNRVNLRMLDAASLERMRPWLVHALAPEWTAVALDAAVEAGSGILIFDASDTPIGAAVAVLESPSPGTVAVPFISIEPERRYRGFGGEAALALERHLRQRFGVQKVFAAVPDWRGLAVYFWLRQGYRPLTRLEAPWPLTGIDDEPRRGIWMLRERP